MSVITFEGSTQDLTKEIVQGVFEKNGINENTQNGTLTVVIKGYLTIKSKAFSGLRNSLHRKIRAVYIDNNLLNIDEEAFQRCYFLQIVYIGNSVKTIKDYAFYECRRLHFAYIGDSVTSIGEFAFSECSTGFLDNFDLYDDNYHTPTNVPPFSMYLGKSIEDDGIDKNAFHNTGKRYSSAEINDSTGHENVIAAYVRKDEDVAIVKSAKSKNVKDYWDKVKISKGNEIDTGKNRGLFFDINNSPAKQLGTNYTNTNKLDSVGMSTGEGSGIFLYELEPYIFLFNNERQDLTKNNIDSNILTENYPNPPNPKHGLNPYEKLSRTDYDIGIVDDDKKDILAIIYETETQFLPQKALKNCPKLEMIILNKNITDTIFPRDITDSLEGCDNLRLITMNEETANTVNITEGKKTNFYGATNVNILINDINPYKIELNGTGVLTKSIVKQSMTNSKESNLIVTITGYKTIGDEEGTKIFDDFKSRLKEVVIGNGVVTIGKYAFQSCDNLTKVTIGRNVEKIGISAFYDCSKLEEVSFHKLNALKTIDIGAFWNCEKLKINIPRTVNKIGSGAFQNCYALENIIIPTNVTMIDYNTFFSCTGVTGLSLSNLTDISANAFKNLASSVEPLTIHIPNTIKNINESAFTDANIKEIFIAETTANNLKVTAGTEKDFFGAKGVTITSGEPLVSFYSMKPGGGKQDLIEIITTDDTGDEPNLYSEVILNSIDSNSIKDIAYIVIHKATKQLQETMDDNNNVTGCFEGLVDAGATNISIIEFEEGSQLVSIGYRAFYGCDSVNITIPDSVEEIYDEAFFGTKSLETFTIGVNSKLERIPKYKKITSYIMPKIFDQQANSGEEPPKVFIPRNVLRKIAVNIGNGVRQLLTDDEGKPIDNITESDVETESRKARLQILNYLPNNNNNNNNNVNFLGLVGSNVTDNFDANKVKNYPRKSDGKIDFDAIIKDGLDDEEKSAILTVKKDKIVGAVLSGLIMKLFEIDNPDDPNSGKPEKEFTLEGTDLYYTDQKSGEIKKIEKGQKVKLKHIGGALFPSDLLTVEIMDESKHTYVNEIMQIQTKVDIISWDNLTTKDQSKVNELVDTISTLVSTEFNVPADHTVTTTIGSGSILTKTSITKGDPGDKKIVNVIPICFAKGTPINTDFGIMKIEDINTYKHTINGKEILSITKSIPNIDEIVKIGKNALKQNVPSKDTYMSKDHKVMIRGKLIECEKLVSKYNNVTLVPYNGVALYNILMKTHDTVMVNNMICETLHPLNIVSKIMNKKMTNKEKQDIFNKLKSKINNTDKRTVLKYIK